MKQSNYNFFFKLDNDNFLAFNALKNGLGVVGRELVETIKSYIPGSKPCMDDNLLKELKRGGFLTEDDFDEYQVLCIRRHMAQYSTDNLGLTIAPTLDCNMNCFYCFEDPDKSIMDQKTTDSLIDFIKSYINAGIKTFGITWYGGEPLLALEIIEYITNILLPLCRKNKIKYTAGIITNGTLLTRKTVRKLKRLAISSVQITLDGDRDTHDKRRVLKSKGSSFDLIMSNLKEIAGLIPVSLRINLDITNVEKAFDFVKNLHSELWFKKALETKMITPYYGHVRDFTSECRCQKEEILKAGDFWSKDLELKRFLYENLKDFVHYPNLSFGCSATTMNSYVVDARGNLYKCWNHLGIPGKKVGTLFEPIEFNPLYIQYITESFEMDEECKKCKVLPICMGGCVDIRVKAKTGEFDSKDCASWKYYLEESLRDFYLAKTR